MAGISFQLEKFLSKETFSTSALAYTFSAVIFSGPWLLSVLTILLLNNLSPINLSPLDLNYFRTIVIYVFAFSFVFVGIIHFPLTRHLSDYFYQNKPEQLIPTFNTAICLVIFAQMMIGSCMVMGIELPFIDKVLTVAIYITMSLLWVIMVFLTAIRSFIFLTVSYFIGCAVCVLLSTKLAVHYGILGYFWGYFIGHLTIASLWIARIFMEYSSVTMFDVQLFKSIGEKKYLVLIGLFYNLTVWVDKFIFWMSPKAIHLSGFIYTYPLYENPVFYAHLTIIPSLCLLLVHVETDMFKKFRAYYDGILAKVDYAELETAKERLIDSVEVIKNRILRCQIIIAGTAIVLAPDIAQLVNMPMDQVPIFRVAVLGTFIHSLLLLLLMMILYLDMQRMAVALTGIFLCSNAILTYWTMNLSQEFYGYGYLGATCVSLLLMYPLFMNRLHKLEFFTFQKQVV